MDAIAVAPTPTSPSFLVSARRSLHEQRGPVLLALLVFVLMIVSAVVVGGHLRELAARSDDFYRAADAGKLLTELLGVVAPLMVALLLVVPVTARAASEVPRPRARELAARLAPMLLIGLAGFALTAFVAGVLRGQIQAYSDFGSARRMELGELGYEGIPYVARGFLAMGVGALMGALVRRTGPALFLAGGVYFSLALLGSPVLQTAVAERVATWTNAPTWNLRHVETGYVEGSGPIMTEAQALARFAEICPHCPREQDHSAIQDHFGMAFRSAMPDTYGTFFAVDVGLAVGIGGACLALTFPISRLRRRRPTGA